MVIPLWGRFKDEEGKRWHTISLASSTRLVIHNIGIAGSLLAAREEINSVKSNWYFVNKFGEKCHLYI